jgi:hypothetical protein
VKAEPVRRRVKTVAKRKTGAAAVPRARRGADPGSTVHLRIADITVGVTARDADLGLQVDEATEKFLVAPSDPDAIVTAAWGDPGGACRGDVVFDSGGVWKLYRDGTRQRFVFSSAALGPLPYKEATFDPDFISGEVTLRRACFQRTQGLWPLEYPLDELLLQGLLARGKGAEIHACGIVDASDRGLLFVGQSGAGKTTMARLWEGVGGATVLSDDRIILRRVGSGFTMYGTPWHGEAALAEPASAPLAGVFFLEHGDANALLPLRGAAAAARLFACGFPPFHDRDGLDFTLTFFAELAAKVPCHELRFAPDRQVVELVQSWAKGI